MLSNDLHHIRTRLTICDCANIHSQYKKWRTFCMKYNKCLTPGEMHKCVGCTDLCVSVDGLWDDGRCGRTFRSRDNPWRTRPDSARDAGTAVAECSQLPSPSPPQHLEHTQHKEGETNGRCVECHFKPALHTLQHLFSLLSVSHCPSFPVLKCANAMQSQIHQTGSRAAPLCSLTERWQFISFSVSLETPQSWDTPPSTPPPTSPPLFFLPLLSSFPLSICWIAVKKLTMLNETERKKARRRELNWAMSASQDLLTSLPATWFWQVAVRDMIGW